MTIPAIIAHRGASGSAPENTLAAIQKALEIGVDYVEIDVRQTKDGVIVLLHDKTLDRTTNGTGDIRLINFSSLKKLDAGSWYGEQFSKEKIPSLEEVIQFINGRCKLLIEVKGNRLLYPSLEEHILEVIYRNNAMNWCVLQCFFTGVLDYFRKLDEKIPLHKLIVSHTTLINAYINGDINLENRYQKYLSYKALNPNYRWINKQLVKKIHANGQKIFCWTVNKEKDMQKMMEMQVDGIITNYPEKLKVLLQPASSSHKY